MLPPTHLTYTPTHCPLYSVHSVHTVHSVLYTLCTAHFTNCTHCTQYIHSTVLYPVQCTQYINITVLYPVQCTQYINLTHSAGASIRYLQNLFHTAQHQNLKNNTCIRKTTSLLIVFCLGCLFLLLSLSWSSLMWL